MARYLPKLCRKRAMSCLSSPVSAVYAWNAWDHDPPLARKTVAFYDSGFPTEARVIRPIARKAYGLIAHEAKPNGLLTRGP